MPIDPATSQDLRPAARDALAAAGPVEPSYSPDLAPGPTLSPAPKSQADYFHTRKTQALVNQARTLYRRGETYAAIARAVGITSDTARRWLDPDYDAHRRSRAAAAAIARDDGEDDAILPTLPFIPGVIVSGRYRMKPSIGPKSGCRFSDEPMREKSIGPKSGCRFSDEPTREKSIGPKSGCRFSDEPMGEKSIGPADA